MNIKKIKKSIETCDESYAKARILAEKLGLDKVINLIDWEIKRTTEGIIIGVRKLQSEAGEDVKKGNKKQAAKKLDAAEDIIRTLPNEVQKALIAKMAEPEKPKEAEALPEGEEAPETEPGKKKPAKKPKISGDEKKFIEWLDDIVKASKTLERCSEKKLDEAKQAFVKSWLKTKNDIPKFIAGFAGKDIEKKKKVMAEILKKMSDSITKEMETVGIDIVSARKQILVDDQRPKDKKGKEIKEGKKLFRLFSMQTALDDIRKAVEEYKE
jgi:hypothetical protein